MAKELLVNDGSTYAILASQLLSLIYNVVEPPLYLAIFPPSIPF